MQLQVKLRREKSFINYINKKIKKKKKKRRRKAFESLMVNC